MQFYEMFFEFDGKRSSNLDFLMVDGKQKQLVIVNMDGSQDSIMGLRRGINEESTSGFAPAFIGFNNECPSFPLTVACLDEETRVPHILTQEQIFEINRWLFQEEYKPFSVYNTFNNPQQDSGAESWRDMIYYVAFTSATKYNIYNGKGYITFEMRLDSPCAYSRVIEHNEVVSGNKTFTVSNKSNVGKYIYPDIEFILTSGTSFSIENVTTGELMEITGLSSNAHIYCYNEGFKYIVDINNPNTNPRVGFNKQWLRYVYGENQLVVRGYGTVKLFHQNKIAIQ